MVPLALSSCREKVGVDVVRIRLAAYSFPMHREHGVLRKWDIEEMGYRGNEALKKRGIKEVGYRTVE